MLLLLLSSHVQQEWLLLRTWSFSLRDVLIDIKHVFR